MITAHARLATLIAERTAAGENTRNPQNETPAD
jgi:hypothetical protein